jgi:hypothetical protein
VGSDYLTNLVIFGTDKFRVDLVGLWLGGHEPGNVHLYRIAKERGLSDTFNPWEVPVFEWTDAGPAARKTARLPADSAEDGVPSAGRGADAAYARRAIRL